MEPRHYAQEVDRSGRRLNRAGRRASAALARLSEKQAAGVAALRRAVEAGGTGRRLVSVEAMGLAEALAAIGATAAEAMVAAYASAHGFGDDMAECFCCRATWTPDRPPVAALKVTLARPDAALVALACRGCAGGAGFQAAVAAAVSRDLFGGGTVEVVPACAIAPRGRA